MNKVFLAIAVFGIALCLLVGYHLEITQITAKSLMTEKLPYYFLYGAAFGAAISLFIITTDYRSGVKGNVVIINAKVACAIIFWMAIACVIVPLFGWLLWQTWFAVYKQLTL